MAIRVMASTQSGKTTSSPSRNITYCPVALSMPAYRAASTPALFWWMAVMQECRAAYLFRISGVWSVEPSLTRMISREGQVWDSRLSRQAEMLVSRL